MKTPLELLNDKAAKAMPPEAGVRSKYAHLCPVVMTLRSGGFSLSAAIAWLVAERQIPEHRKNSAYRSLRQILIRRATPRAAAATAAAPVATPATAPASHEMSRPAQAQPCAGGAVLP